MNIRLFYALGNECYGKVVNLEAVANIARSVYGERRIVGGSHTRPLQAALLRAGVGRSNPGGKSVTVSVSELVAFAERLGEGYADGTNSHNHVSAEDVLKAIAAPPPWYAGSPVNWSEALSFQAVQ